MDTNASSDYEAVYIVDGKPVRNGEPDANVYSSSELLANIAACSAGDADIERLREEWAGRIVG